MAILVVKGLSLGCESEGLAVHPLSAPPTPTWLGWALDQHWHKAEAKSEWTSSTHPLAPSPEPGVWQPLREQVGPSFLKVMLITCAWLTQQFST